MPTALELTSEGWKSYLASAQDRVMPEPTVADADMRELLLNRVREAVAVLKSRFGVRRVILGTIAVEQPMLVAQAVEKYGAERIGVAIDARDGQVRTRGWLAETLHEPAGLADDMKAMGIRIIVFTDITRDGLSTGIALETTRNLAEQTGLAVIASGGAASLADVHAAYSAGLAGLIIGRALYEGHVNLSSALAVGSPDQEE